MINRASKRVWSGEYACSICGERFQPDPADPAKLSADFDQHKMLHSAALGR